MPYKDLEKRKEYHRRYMQKRRNTPEGKKESRKAQQKYRSSPEGVEKRRKFERKRYHTPKRKQYCKKYQKEYRKRPKAIETARRYHLKKTYNISIDEYNRLFTKQRCECAICQESIKTNRNFAIDHNHKCCPGKKSCGKCIRGLLCNRCNTILGLGDDSILLFQSIIAYLERTKNVNSKDIVVPSK
jgi:Recombination endonuclease VII